MLENLPAPIQRYLSYTGVVGMQPIKNVQLKYSGKFRTAADKPWMSMVAKQHYNTDPASFVWKANFKIAGLPLLSVTDRYENGKGAMLGKLAGLVTLFNVSEGVELAQGSMMRYLNEVMWFPTAFFSEKITWQAIDDESAQVTYTDFGMSVSARLQIDAEGRLSNFIGERYREVQGSYRLDNWSTPIDAYGEFNGLKLPSHGVGMWSLPDGDFSYIELAIEEIIYA